MQNTKKPTLFERLNDMFLLVFCEQRSSEIVLDEQRTTKPQILRPQ